MEGFWRSCFDFRWLLARKDRPWSAAFVHLAVLAVVLTLARTASVGPMVEDTISRGEEFVNKEMPEVVIRNGQASSAVVQPWTKILGEQFQIIIDTTGKSLAIDAQYPTGVLIAKDRIVYRRGPGTDQVFDLAPVKSFSTRGPKMVEMVSDIRRWVYPAVIPVLAVLTVGGMVVRWILVAALGLMFAQALGAPLVWRQVALIGAYAVTPAVYVLLLGTLTPLRVALIPTLAQAFFLGMAVWLSKEEAGQGGQPSGNGHRG